MIRKLLLKTRRHNRIRAKVSGTATRPRLVVSRSLAHLYAQLIDDASGKTVAAASDLKIKKGSKMERAKTVGLEIAQKALDQKIEMCVFDRSGYRYHGRVKALAEAAREGGLKF